MDFKYRKISNREFVNKESAEILGVTDTQSYIPIYDRFFKCNEATAQSISLNNRFILSNVRSRKSYNAFSADVVDVEEGVHEKPIFVKFSPLVDPIKFMLGKYDNDSTSSITAYPKFGDTVDANTCHPKMLDNNNVSYVDGFFSYLSSRLLHDHGFEHGTDYYGSFLGTKDNLEIDVQDDIEYLENSEHFHEYNGSLFHVDEDLLCDGTGSRKYRPPININGSDADVCLDDLVDVMGADIVAETQPSRPERKYTFDMGEIKSEHEKDVAGFHLRGRSGSQSSRSECSSDSSVTNEGDVEGPYDSDENSDGSESSEGTFGSECSEDDQVNCMIPNFPVQAIAMECCDGTLDSLFTKDNLAMKRPQLRSAMFQIVMSLLVFQKAFHFTHNDLHTNNIVWSATDRKYLFYKHNSKYYKVPTYGRIFKIIDFGRAIYRFRGETMCSDSYHPTGDAGSQYNCEPYFNPSKPRLEPHFGFDLARLGCSLYELVDAEDVDDNGIINEEKLGDVERMIVSWCRDDKGRNILFKRNGDERYPGFKLYKMIARTSHEHTPEKMLAGYVFDTYLVSAKKCKKQPRLMDVDAIPDYGEVVLGGENGKNASVNTTV
jgi:hypothetical protein